MLSRMRFACWVRLHTHTHRICNNYCFSTATVVWRTRLSITLQVHYVSCSSTMHLDTSKTFVYLNPQCIITGDATVTFFRISLEHVVSS
jgi:hypothetical protein